MVCGLYAHTPPVIRRGQKCPYRQVISSLWPKPIHFLASLARLLACQMAVGGHPILLWYSRPKELLVLRTSTGGRRCENRPSGLLGMVRFAPSCCKKRDDLDVLLIFYNPACVICHRAGHFGARAASALTQIQRHGFFATHRWRPG